MATYPFTGDPLAQVEEIYVGYFGRAGDPNGTNFWVGFLTASGDTTAALQQVAAAFSVTPEAKAVYPFLANPLIASTADIHQFLDSVYENLFARPPDAGGLAFWTNYFQAVIATGNLTFIAQVVGQSILTIASVAQAPDQAVLQAKVNAAEVVTQEFSAAGINFPYPPVTDAQKAAFDFAHIDVAAVHGAADLPQAAAAAAEFGNNPPTGATFTLTVGQDTFHGTGHDTFNAPLAGVFGDQATLTDFDNLTDTGTFRNFNTPSGGQIGETVVGVAGIPYFLPFFASTLNASFDGSHTAAGVNIDGIPVWNIQNDPVAGTVNINGGSGHVIRGLSILNYNANGGFASLNIGTAAQPIQALTVAQGGSGTWNGFILNIANALGAGHVDLAMRAADFSGTDTIHVNAQFVGTSTDFYDIAAGSPTAGFQTWDVHSLGGPGNFNNIGLGADGSSAAQNLTLSDDGSDTTLWAASASGSDAGDWANLTTIDLTGTSGFVTLTGGENGSDGLLSANTSSLHTILGGSGNSLYDLTALSLAAVNSAGFLVQGGSGTSGNSEVEFNNSVITGVNHAINIQNIQVLDDSADSQGGIINMAFWPIAPLNVAFDLPAGGSAPAGFALLQFLDADSNASTDLNSNLTINNGPSQFAINMQDMDTHAHNITINAGPVINLADHLIVYASDEGTVPVYTINNYTTTDFFLPFENGDNVQLGTDLFVVQPVVSVNNATLNFFDNPGDTGGGTPGPDDLFLGDTAGLARADIGHATVLLDATLPTTINFFGAGDFTIGATDVSNLNAQSAAKLVMELPATGNGVGGGSGENLTLVHGIDVHGSLAGPNLLQGSSGPVANTVATTVFPGATNDSVFGATAGDVLTGGTSTDNFFGAGGNDVINVGADAVHDVVFFAQYDIDHTGTASPGTILHQAITDVNAAGNTESFVNNYASSITTINQFSAGAGNATHDTIDFSVFSWALATALGGPVNALTFTNGVTSILGGGADAIFSQIGTANTQLTVNGTVIMDGINTYANAAQLQTALLTTGAGNILLNGTGVQDGETSDILIAYQNAAGDVHIADLTLHNNAGGAANINDTAAFTGAAGTLQVHDLAILVGVGGLGALATNNIHFN